MRGGGAAEGGGPPLRRRAVVHIPGEEGDEGILGHGGGRQEGGRKWAGRGGIRIFPAGGEGALFASGGGEGYCKIFKKSPENALLKKFLKIVQNLCNFPFLGTFFIISTCSMRKIFS